MQPFSENILSFFKKKNYMIRKTENSLLYYQYYQLDEAIAPKVQCVSGLGLKKSMFNVSLIDHFNSHNSLFT